MIIFFLLMLLALFAKCHIGRNPEYISRYNTTKINGGFIIIVFFRHVFQYTPKLTAWYDHPFTWINLHIGQFLVTTFLFYSGYGVLCSIRNKSSYILEFPRKRIFKVWLDFAFIVCLYLLLYIFLKTTPDFLFVLKSFIGWESLGNSNWYIFCILCLYLITWFSFGLVDFMYKHNWRTEEWVPIIAVTLMTIVYILQMRIWKDGMSYWYSTALCYPAGMWYAFFQKRFEKHLLESDRIWFVTLIITLTLTLTLYLHRSFIWFYEASAIGFTILVVLISMRFSFDSKAYYWMGKNLFSLYMLQRLPMIYLDSIGLSQNHTHIYIYACFIIMILLTILYNKLIGLLKSYSSRSNDTWLLM